MFDCSCRLILLSYRLGFTWAWPATCNALSEDADGIMLHISVIPLLRPLVRAGALRVD